MSIDKTELDILRFFINAYDVIVLIYSLVFTQILFMTISDPLIQLPLSGELSLIYHDGGQKIAV